MPMSALLPRRDEVSGRIPDRAETRLITQAALCASLAGLAIAVAGPVVVGPLVGAALFAVAAYRPVFATYAYLLTLPFLAGIERGALVPGARPNEALFAVLVAGACLGGWLRLLRGDPIPLRLRPLDVPLAGFVVLSTVWPIASMMLRGAEPHGSDLMALLPVCKLVALFLLVRLTVHTEQQRLRCIRLVIWPTAGLSIVAILQTLGVEPVLTLLSAFWHASASEASDRGTATLGSSIATGDYITVGLVLLLYCGTRGILGKWERIGLGVLLGAGVLASGQFSTWISALVAGVLILRRYPQARQQVARYLPIVGIAALVGAPAFLGRMADFTQGYTVPRSWLGRWDNLTTFYLPQLADGHFVLGISPDSVLTAPETWRDYIYLESGYLYFLWVGGIPLLIGFVWLSVAVLRGVSRLAARPGSVGACAATLEVAWWMVLVLSLIDIHLAVRGFGDLLFVLLAIMSGRLGDDEHGTQDPALDRSRTT
ncbi:hypothetical protein ACH347_36790 [Saccharopolyspora sp. 5N102]|uniref:hypothetical protein n=1 Tax=Saccharopolyspora sp. 5N102 TaxID=3375155 RepID=UPI003795E49D